MSKSVKKKLRRLVDHLAGAPETSLQFNMYKGTDGEPFKENLLRFLASMVAREPRFLFLGEAAGVHGARWTGIPFTDNLTLRFPPLVGNVRAFTERYHLGDNYKYEQSSCPLWRVMQIHGRLELLWNACPFVPHECGHPTIMRDTLQVDIFPYDGMLENLISAFPSVQHVVGVGKEATAAAKRVLKGMRKRVPGGMSRRLSLHEVRHPSRQANIFIAEALEVLGDPAKRVVYF